MSGRGKPAGRKRKAQTNLTENEEKRQRDEAPSDHDVPEFIQLLASDKSENTNKRGKCVDFQTLIDESNIFPNSSSTQVYELNRPEMIRCGGDSLGIHVPEQIQIKIKQNEYINMAVLLKGAVELNNQFTNAVLSVDESGTIVSAPRANSEKIPSIEKWTDAFLIYSSIYLQAHPDHTQHMLNYMFTIREAAAKFGGTGWRTYDEQFRLRQSKYFSPWSKINADLWLRCFSGNIGAQANRPFSIQPNLSPPCIDFNKGFCQWNNCRFRHVCAVCQSPKHGSWSCYMKEPHLHPQQTQPHKPNNSFRGSYRGAFRFQRGQGQRFRAPKQ